MRVFAAAGALAAAVVLTGCSSASTSTSASEAPAVAKADAGTINYASGLRVADTRAGTGPFPKRGQVCVMHYTGWLYQNGQKGAKFDSSVDRGKPFEFPLGAGAVIKGWDEGVAGMKVGGKRTLIIPPDLGYGGNARTGIPAYSTLIFEVELLAVKG
jgi:FKBP-type peptidyl-prolyl cis-trans isomerase FkpA